MFPKKYNKLERILSKKKRIAVIKKYEHASKNFL